MPLSPSSRRWSGSRRSRTATPPGPTPPPSTRSSRSWPASSRCCTSASSSPGSTPTRLLFHWRGRAATRPVVLMAHLDVVPVDEDAPWQRPAFGAEIVDGEIWGRGTLDDKGCLVGICEAVERLLADGFEPAQDVWLSFGCDEEVSGAAAGLAVAELDAARRPALVRPRRGRRGRRRRVPRHRGAGGGHRGHREGRDVARALRRGPRRPRLDARRSGPDGPDRPGDHPPRARAVPRRACRRRPRR